MKAHIVAAGCAMFCLMAAQSAMALTIDYSSKAFPAISSWGTMDINVVDKSTLSVLYTAAGTLPTNTQATGFGFSFDGKQHPISISNPVDTNTNNDPSLTWHKLVPPTNPKKGDDAAKLPTVTNIADFPAIDSHYAFEMAATEGVAKTFTPTGIHAGKKDIFYLNFAQDIFSAGSAFDLASFVELTAVRLQGIEEFKEGSLLLAGTERDPSNPVPEPATMMLLGAGFLGLAIYGKRRSKNA